MQCTVLYPDPADAEAESELLAATLQLPSF